MLLVVAILSACAGTPCKRTYQPPQATNDGFLWEATKDGRAIVVLGTHQAAGHQYVSPAAWELLKSSDTFMAEVDEVEVGDRYKLDEWEDIFTLPHGQSLVKLLSHDLYYKLQRLLEGSRIAIPTYLATHGPVSLPLERTKPWVAMLLLSKQTFRFPHPNINSALLAAANDSKLKIRFFENVKQQVQFLVESVGIEKLRRTLREELYVKCRVEDSVAAFAAGDDEAFVLSENDPIVARIDRWMPILGATATESRRLFLAVGVGHLLGERGILTRLRQQGYVVTRK